MFKLIRNLLIVIALLLLLISIYAEWGGSHIVDTGITLQYDGELEREYQGLLEKYQGVGLTEREAKRYNELNDDRIKSFVRQAPNNLGETEYTVVPIE